MEFPTIRVSTRRLVNEGNQVIYKYDAIECAEGEVSKNLFCCINRNIGRICTSMLIFYDQLNKIHIRIREDEGRRWQVAQLGRISDNAPGVLNISCCVTFL